MVRPSMLITKSIDLISCSIFQVKSQSVKATYAPPASAVRTSGIIILIVGPCHPRPFCPRALDLWRPLYSITTAVATAQPPLQILTTRVVQTPTWISWSSVVLPASMPRTELPLVSSLLLNRETKAKKPLGPFLREI